MLMNLLIAFKTGNPSPEFRNNYLDWRWFFGYPCGVVDFDWRTNMEQRDEQCCPACGCGSGRRRRPGALVIIAIALVAAVILPVCLGIADYKRADRLKRPVFSIRTAIMKDGGTEVYYGWGYRLLRLNRIAVPADQEAPAGQAGFEVGPDIRWWFGARRANTRNVKPQDGG